MLMNESVPTDKLGYEVGLWEVNSNTLYWSVVIDKKENINVYQNPYFNAWYKYFLFSQENIFITYLHPELFFINDSIVNTLVLPFTGMLYFAISLKSTVESYISPIFSILQVIIGFVFFILFIMLYFSYYTNSVKEENTIDQDFLVSAMTVEAEEEIASIDDSAMSLFLLIYIFGWYFYANSVFLLNNVPEVSMLFYHLPFLYYIIFFIPTLLLYDFGIFFLTYLRGASTTPSFAMEMLYDYIAFVAFYIRLVVQNVRLLLMTFTYFSLYECILSFIAFSSWFNQYEILWEGGYNYTSYSSYYFLIKVPSQIIYWLYELLHTFFVVTAQFIAFFAMVFWLFLFLYTMFVMEQQEHYFGSKRLERKQMLQKLLIE